MNRSLPNAEKLKKQFPVSLFVKTSPSKSAVISLCSIALIIWAGCATTPKTDPFKVPKAEVRAAVKTIALSPVATPTNLGNLARIQSEFLALIESRLRAGGFVVIPAKEVADLWAASKKELGGFYDPVTGKRDDAKYEAARKRALQGVREKLHADAVLFPSIQYVPVHFANDRAEWHGTSEKLASGWQTVFVGSHSGSSHAFSLRTILEDSNGRSLFVNHGGIQLAAKIAGRDFVAVPPNELFTDAKRNQAAVDIALDPLVN
jgi:hypothetical protein